MKKWYILLMFPVVFLLISWGFNGHKTIGQIAWRHLSPQAKTAVRELLGDESLAGAATWADEVRNDPQYRKTVSWHFINVPTGLSFEQFKSQVANAGSVNAYKALLSQEKTLSDPKSSHEERLAALKFIAHFVGDIHQPMHVSRAEDKGGNTVQLSYDGKGTNLHALWDTKLLEHIGLNYQELAEKYDHPSEAEIKEWQAQPPIIWAWESYQISGKLYEEADGMKGRNIGDDYYEKHFGIIERRIEQAGIRLAGVLNTLFKNAKPGEYGTATIAEVQNQPEQNRATTIIRPEDAEQHLNESVQVMGKVYGVKDFGTMVLVNLGAAYPNNPLTVVLRSEARELNKTLQGKTILVSGLLISYKNKPEIVVTSASQIQVQ
jgi:hypothetical protein